MYKRRYCATGQPSSAVAHPNALLSLLGSISEDPGFYQALPWHHMSKNALRNAFRLSRDVQSDVIARAFSPSVRASIVHATTASEEARRRFEINQPEHAALLAHGVCAASALASFQKG